MLVIQYTCDRCGTEATLEAHVVEPPPGWTVTHGRQGRDLCPECSAR